MVLKSARLALYKLYHRMVECVELVSVLVHLPGVVSAHMRRECLQYTGVHGHVLPGEITMYYIER